MLRETLESCWILPWNSILTFINQLQSSDNAWFYHQKEIDTSKKYLIKYFYAPSIAIFLHRLVVVLFVHNKAIEKSHNHFLRFIATNWVMHLKKSFILQPLPF